MRSSCDRFLLMELMQRSISNGQGKKWKFDGMCGNISNTCLCFCFFSVVSHLLFQEGRENNVENDGTINWIQKQKKHHGHTKRVRFINLSFFVTIYFVYFIHQPNKHIFLSNVQIPSYCRCIKNMVTNGLKLPSSFPVAQTMLSKIIGTVPRGDYYGNVSMTMLIPPNLKVVSFRPVTAEGLHPRILSRMQTCRLSSLHLFQGPWTRFPLHFLPHTIALLVSR